MGPMLRLKQVTKHFGAVQALNGVDLALEAGVVVALVGDNGAGKSTIVRGISGVSPFSTGEMYMNGEPIKLPTPSDALRQGIATTYQDLALCDNLDVVANLFLGQPKVTRAGRSIGWRDELAMERSALDLLSQLSVKIENIRAAVSELSGGQRQSVTIARSLLGAPEVVLLDEPTAALGVNQTKQVLELVLRLKEQGHAVMLISHNLQNVFQVADRIEVLRLGRNAGCFDARTTSPETVVAAMTGADAARGAASAAATTQGKEALQ